MKKSLVIISVVYALVVVVLSGQIDRKSTWKITEEKLAINYNFEDMKIGVPIYDDMVPQGLTIYRNYVLISSYDYKEKNNSVIYVLEKNGSLKNISTLDMVSHVGGISYDSKNGLVWIAGNNGYVRAYKIEDIINEKEVKYAYEFFVGDKLNNFKNSSNNAISFLTYYDETLFVGSFSLKNDGVVKKYKIKKKDNEIKLSYISDFKIPDKVQGMSIYKKSGKEYVFFSISYGRKNSSALRVYNYDKKVFDYNKLNYYEEILPPMLEQVTIDNNYLYVLYESGAKVYNNCIEINDSISIINALNIINNLE